MKKQLFLLVCLVLAATAAIAQTQTSAPVLANKQAELSTWKRYTVEGERFSVSLPTVPAMTTQKMLIRELRKTRRERRIGVYADGVVYSVFVYENIARESLEDFVADQKKWNSTWEVSTETPVTAGDVTGKQYTSLGKTLNETVQFFSAEGRLYQFSATGYPAEDAVKQFFSSIVFSKNAEGTEINDGEGLPFSNPTCEQGLTGRQVDNKVRVVMKPEPSYTESARQEQVVGTVVLKVIFACNGSVVNIVTVKELPNGLTQQAIAAARKIKFVPAVKGGKYVSMWMQLEYNFNLY
jgi:TonB family protein